ncbi:MAG: acyl-CoA carboxylase subunit epsilon [Actinomycetes bacterium]
MSNFLDAESLKIVKGDVTAEEIAALVVVLNAAIAQNRSTQRSRVSPEWNAPHRAIRKPVMHGVNAWRRSALPL